MTEPRIHVPIDGVETVVSSSEGAVTRTNWNPNSGWSRKQQIEEARIEALKEQAAKEEAALPWNVTIARLEGAVADLQKRVQILELQKDA